MPTDQENVQRGWDIYQLSKNQINMPTQTNNQNEAMTPEQKSDEIQFLENKNFNFEDCLVSTIYEEPLYVDRLMAEFADQLKERIKELNKRNKWIWVEEKLPEEATKVIVWNGSEIDFASLASNGRWYLYRNSFNGETLKIIPIIPVTHWMPLSEPPKK